MSLGGFIRACLLPGRRSTKNPQLSVDIVQALASREASSLRAIIKEGYSAGRENFPFTTVVDQARSSGWDDRELEKLIAYGELFSGDTARGYQRIISGHLAEDDYPLFMTAFVFCYRFNRFDEGYQLLQQFRPARANQVDEGKYLAFAGWMVLAAGRSIDEATGYFDQALDSGLMTLELGFNAYPAYFEAGRHHRVAELRQLMHDTYCDDPEVNFALAYVELCRDYYPEGFRLAESRYRMSEVSKAINPSLLKHKRWDGEPLHGKCLLVHGEQGFGDVVMMARYLPLLEAMGAQVVLDCHDAAIPLLAESFPNCRFIPVNMAKPVAVTFDFWTGVMSLPFHFETTVETVPATAGYLSVPAEQQEYWGRRMNEISSGASLKVGLAWSGNPSHKADRRRSIPFDLIAQYVAAIPEVQFYALQTRVPEHRPPNMLDVSDEMVTLADTAAIAMKMDLVISVDTSIVHIAGALNVRTWLLLPRRYEWRWGLSGERNNWYESVRVLRQEVHGDWGELLGKVFRKRLPELVAVHGERA